VILDAEVSGLDQVLEFVNRKLEEAECPMKTQMQIDIAVEEMFVNIASYAYKPGTGKATIQVRADGKTRTARITLIDSGVPFDPLMKPDPDVTLTAEQRGIGGLGIYMVKKSMDFVTYFRKNEQNTFTMVKKW
jgi:anti-sigma regulatory factor (Ser/Thr protein kinase)